MKLPACLPSAGRRKALSISPPALGLELSMRVISETADWESLNLINERNAAGGFLSGIGEEDNPGFRRNQRTLFKLLRGSTS